MSSLQEVEQEHLKEQADLSIKLLALQDETDKLRKRLNEVNVVLNTFKFVQTTIEEAAKLKTT